MYETVQNFKWPRTINHDVYLIRCASIFRHFYDDDDDDLIATEHL